MIAMTTAPEVPAIDIAPREAVIQLVGRLAHGETSGLGSMWNSTSAGGSLVVDVSHVTFVDGSGLQALVALVRQARYHDVDVKIQISNTPVGRALARSGLGRIVEVAHGA